MLEKPSTEARPTNQLMSPEEAGAHLGVSRTFVYRILWAGDIPSLKIGRLRKVRRSDLDAYIAARMEGGNG